MKVILYFSFLFLITSCSSTLYVVRHAEKVTTVKDNPPLTPEGEQRAKDLAILLQSKKLKAIYSTDTKRTIGTAQPTALQKDKSVVLYKHDTVVKTLQTIGGLKGNTLIVGHSNTIIPILEKMGIVPDKKNVPDWEYDNLFIVKYKLNKSKQFIIKKVKYSKYGTASKPNLAEPSMKQ